MSVWLEVFGAAVSLRKGNCTNYVRWSKSDRAKSARLVQKFNYCCLERCSL